ncbi:MAG: alkaline phosphatase family protein, partial [Sphingomonas bacterium]|nr:alkaline phosphatase family protein [Sphingomonas bacterium]
LVASTILGCRATIGEVCNPAGFGRPIVMPRRHGTFLTGMDAALVNKLLAACLAALTASPVMAAPLPVPRLIVAISVDQLSSNLFERNRARFHYGLKRLVSEGVVFPSGYQSHGATETCPGHSTLLTGRHPAATGIAGNSWRDQASGEDVYCVFDPAHPVPGREGQGRGPGNLRVSTLGEWMRAANPASRNVAISGKDRSAITMSGHGPTAVFWWDDERGFTTSVPAGTRENERMAPIAGLNAAIDARWRTAAPRWIVADKACATPPETRTYGKLEVTHQLPPAGFAVPARGSAFRADPKFTRWFRASPMLDSVVIEGADRLIDHYRLGRGTAPDLLSVSLSATDYVGHRYGNDGPEMCDNLAHLDRLLGRFLDRLDRLGVPVLVVLSADHGSADAAERAAERGVPARRVGMARLVKDVGAEVQAELGLGFAPLAGDEQVSIVGTDDPAMRRRIGAAALARLRARPEISAAFTRDELLAVRIPPDKPADELSLAERLAESTTADRSGDIVLAVAPYTSIGIPQKYGDAIAGHGTPWNYDRRVPILFWWKGAEAFEQPAPAETVDIAPTLAAILDIAPPTVDGRCLDLDRGTSNSCNPATPR